MKKEWFVLNTLTGQENKAQESIKARTRLENMGEYIGQCLIPSEVVTETKDGVKRRIKKKFFPGCLFLEVALYRDPECGEDEFGRRLIYENVWQFVRQTPGVIGFLGGDRDRPTPLKQSEMDAILTSGPGKSNEPVERPKVIYNVNDVVKVNDGPFMGLTGVVSVVDSDKDKLKVEVQVFNRTVPVDVEPWQVERLTAEELADNPTA